MRNNFYNSYVLNMTIGHTSECVLVAKTKISPKNSAHLTLLLQSYKKHLGQSTGFKCAASKKSPMEYQCPEKNDLHYKMILHHTTDLVSIT